MAWYKLISVEPGSPPTCTVEFNGDGKRHSGVRMIVGPNGWTPMQRDMLDILQGRKED